MVLFIILNRVVLTLKSVNKTLVCSYSNERYRAVLSFSTAVNAVHVRGDSNF